MATIFDIITASNIGEFWNEMNVDREPFLGEVLFPDDKKVGLKLDWIKGASGSPVVLKPSAYDVGVIPRPRDKFEIVETSMPFFKESVYIDEETRQMINIVIDSNNQQMLDTLIRRVFNNTTALVEGASAQRERMRMALITAGAIDIVANGQRYSYDYNLPAEHKVESSTPWANPDADIVGDIQSWQDTVDDNTGSRPTRMVLSRKTWNYILTNNTIKKTVFVMSGGGGAMSDLSLRTFLATQLGITPVVYNKRFVNEAGATVKYVPDDVVSLLPEEQLGRTWFGTTPEESDLLTSGIANVAIVDTGVAITTMQKQDPVQVETKVSMISLPSFENADKVLIADIK